jgi:hypothetical protein
MDYSSNGELPPMDYGRSLDLSKKWGRKFPQHIARSLPWDLLDVLVSGLSADTKLPREVLTECIRTRDISGLFSVASSHDVTAYTSPDLLLQDRLVVELFSKFDFQDSPFNKKERALLRFHEAEERCRETNFRVSRSIGMSNDINRVLHNAIRIIDKVLGEFVPSEMLEYSRFGPGSTLCVKGAYTTEYFKYCGETPSVTPDCALYAEALIATDYQWKAHLYGVHPFDVCGPFSPIKEKEVKSETNYNKVAFVPKNAKTFRSIAIEPYFNVYFQLGVGGMIRRRLFRRAGINLDSQLRNQILAHKGSITGDLATIDFSMASDTISIETVRLLVSDSWFKHLDRLRSKNYMLEKGKPRFYQKFSSMGNGFTFELETLIFYALAIACCEDLGVETKDVSVFGDDVIIPTSAFSLYETVCTYLGFKTNEEKSFASGNFRESCGEDYLGGINVRPVFCKELDTTQHVVSLANRLSALNCAVGFGSRINDMLRNAVCLLHRRIPRDVFKQVVGPPTENVDGYIHTTCIARLAGSDYVRWNHHRQHWEYPTIGFKPTKRKCNSNDTPYAMWILNGLRQTRNPIPKQKRMITGHRAFSRIQLNGKGDVLRQALKLDDVLPPDESTERSVTGREVGELTLGQAVFWNLE